MALINIFLLVLLLIVIGSFPIWPYSSGWGYYPSGSLGALLVLLIVLRLFGII
jgi:hypothetical protein